MEIAPVLTDLGTTVAVLAIFGWLIWKLVTPFIDRLMDNLDRQAQSYERYMEAQVKATMTLDTLCNRLDGIESEHLVRATARKEQQDKSQRTQEEIVATLRGVQQQLQAHEGRAHQRHEQQLEQGRQIVKALQALNGHSK